MSVVVRSDQQDVRSAPAVIPEYSESISGRRLEEVECLDPRYVVATHSLLCNIRRK